MPEADESPVTDDDVVAFVVLYAERIGLGKVEGVSLDTRLEELGLDSITTVGLLVEARDELTAAGRLPASATLRELPPLERVADLAALLRSLGPVGG
jgi:acyl carrier protein